jgi:hypothetical protein
MLSTALKVSIDDHKAAAIQSTFHETQNLLISHFTTAIICHSRLTKVPSTTLFPCRVDAMRASKGAVASVVGKLYATM